MSDAEAIIFMLIGIILGVLVCVFVDWVWDID